jgi:hypothetical protein
MRPIIYVAAGLVLLIVVVIAGSLALVGGSISFVAAKKVDVSDPNAAETFRTNFQTTCGNLATKRLGQADYQAVALVKQVCACDANALIAFMRRHNGMTVLDLGKRLTSRDPEITRAFESCNQAYGIDVEPD